MTAQPDTLADTATREALAKLAVSRQGLQRWADERQREQAARGVVARTAGQLAEKLGVGRVRRLWRALSVYRRFQSWGLLRRG
jgi:hypothetical protein